MEVGGEAGSLQTLQHCSLALTVVSTEWSELVIMRLKHCF